MNGWNVGDIRQTANDTFSVLCWQPIKRLQAVITIHLDWTTGQLTYTGLPTRPKPANICHVLTRRMERYVAALQNGGAQ